MSQILIAILLLVLGLALLAIEFIVISWGFLTLAALGCAIAAIAVAFGEGTATGYAFVVATLVLGTLVIRWGFAWMMRSRSVRGAEIIEDAGYHHAVAKAGITLGAEGELVTNAFPSGRARFTGADGCSHELDVRLQTGSGERGTRVRVTGLAGASVTVVAVTPAT